MEQLRIKDEDRWLEIWEGHTKQVLDGAIYADEIRQVIKDNRIGKVPYDPSRVVHTAWDCGHSDQTAIWFIQTVGMYYNIIDYFQDSLKKIGYYQEILREKKYNYGIHYLPHDADNETLASRSVNQLMISAGFKPTRIIARPAKKFLGINAARTVFEFCNFDEINTADGMQCLRRYCYDVDENGKFSKEPKHDQYSHGADAFQTFALSLKTEINSQKVRTITTATKGISLRNQGANNWMGS